MINDKASVKHDWNLGARGWSGEQEGSENSVYDFM